MAHRHDRYADPGVHDGIQLCVRHIPLDFDAELLLEVFSEYGEVMDVSIPQKAYLQAREYLFGFVVYLHKSDALSAIDGLNGKPPYYLSVEVSRQTSVELLREQTQSTLQYAGEVSSGPRRHSSMGYNYMMTVSPTGQRIIQGMQSGELVRRSFSFGNRGGMTAKKLLDGYMEDEDLPAPGQKQMFPCYKCGNLTFRKCVCGGAYYCKEACRLSNWPNHQADCLKKLESQRDCEAGPFSGDLHKSSKGVLDTSLAGSFSNSIHGQVENGIHSEQAVDRSHGHKPPRFPVVSKIEGLKSEKFGNRNEETFSGFSPRNDVDSMQDKMFSNKQSLNYQNLDDSIAESDGIPNNENKSSLNSQHSNCYSNQNQKKSFEHRDCDGDGWMASGKSSDNQINLNKNPIQGTGGDKRDFTHPGRNGNRNFNRGGGCDAVRNFNQHGGDHKRSSSQQNGDNRSDFNHRAGENRRNFNQQDSGNRRNFNQLDDDSRTNFNQQGYQRNFNEQDNDSRRNFNKQDGDSRRNFNQRSGNNRRNFNQQDVDKKLDDVDCSQNDRKGRKNLGSNNCKSFSFGAGDKHNTWKGKHSEEMMQKTDESEETWDTPDVEKVVQTIPQENVEAQVVLQEKVEYNITTGTVDKNLVPSTCVGIQSEREKVCVVMKDGPKTFFIQRLVDNNTLKRICEEVVKCPSLPVVKQPQVGLLCAAMFEGEWYRARVLMLMPQLTVQYLDYGNIDVCDPGTLHSLPESIVNLPPMAEKIVFDDESPDQLLEGVIISIKRTGKTEDGITKVKLDDGKGAALSTQPTAVTSPGGNSAEKEATVSSLQGEAAMSVAAAGNESSAASTTDAGMVLHALSTSRGEIASAPFQVLVVVKEGPKTFFVQRLANINILQLICKEVVNSQSLPLVKPEVGLLCAAMYEGEWYRARVLMLTPQLAVQYIDYGNIDVCDPGTLHSLPESIIDFPPMAEKIEFVDETPDKYSTLSEGDTVVIKPVGQVVDGYMKVCVDDGKSVTSSTLPASTVSLSANQQVSSPTLHAEAAPLTCTASQKQSVSSVDPKIEADVGVPVASTLHPVVPSVDSMLQLDNKPSLVTVKADNVSKEFMKAKITVINGPTDYWVTWEHDLDTVDQIILKIHKNITSTPLVNPKVGLLCAAKFDGIWFRARITRVSPQFEVHYIDYGNTEVCDSNDLHDLPDIVKDFPPMCFRVQLADGTPPEYQNLVPDSLLSIKVVEKNEAGLHTVQIEGVKYPDVPMPVTESAAVNSIPSDPMPTVQQVTSVLAKADTQAEKISASVKLLESDLPQNSSNDIPVTVINATKFYEVRVAITLGGNDYWVQRVSRDAELQLVLVEVNEHASKCIRTTPEVGKLCAAQFQSFWYRALIKRVSPDLEVHFIDFGNTETVTSDILELPESVVGLSALALRIRLADGTPEKFSNLPVDSTISVKPVKKATDNATIVQVEGVQYIAETEDNTLQEVAGSAARISSGRQFGPGGRKPEPNFQNTCLKFLTTEGNNGGALHFMKKYSDHYYTVTAVTDTSRSVYDKLIELRKTTVELLADNPFKPEVGDLVLALSPSQGGLCRAQVVSESKGSYRVILLDCGIIETVTVVRELAPSLAVLPRFAVKCVVTNFHVNKEKFFNKCSKSEDAFIFQVKSVKDSQVMCWVLSMTNVPLCSVILSVWQPRVEEIGLIYVDLQDNDPVRMTCYCGPNEVYITSLVPEHVQQFSTFSETLHAYCSQVGYLQHPPQVGDLLACKFDDNMFYRCRVQSVFGSFCDILYIDYGNSESGVMFDKLKIISEDLKKFPCQCLKVKLKDVTTSKMTFKLTDYIKKLVDNNVVLQMEKYSDGVILRTHTGISVNEEIIRLADNVNSGSAVVVDASPCNSSSGNEVGDAVDISSLSKRSLSSIHSSAIEDNNPDHETSPRKCIMSSALKHKTWPLGETKICVLGILKDLSLMACPCDQSAAEAVENLTVELNDYCSVLPVEPYYPQVDEVCIAKFQFDDQWYRAVCLVAIPNMNTRKLMFVDYGNVEDVEVSSIRRMEPQFMNVQVLVEKCNIEGIDVKNKLVENKVKEIICTDKLYDVRIIEHLPTHYLVEIPLLKAALQAENLYVEGI